MRVKLKSAGLALPIVFSVFLSLASFDVVNKYFGLIGAVGYSIVVFASVIFIYRHGLTGAGGRISAIISERQAVVLTLATFILLAAVAFVGYPIANSGLFGGGSDADDALILAASELIAGRYPFYPATYLGNAIAPLPGAIFLAVPFVALNILPLQNVVWLAVFQVILCVELRSKASALILLWLTLILSPAVFQNLVTATDRTANSIYILTGLWLLIRAIRLPGKSGWVWVAAAVLLGIGLSSRSNFILIVPIFFSYLVQNAGLRTAFRYTAVTGIVSLVITLPFWLYDPAGFSPFINQSEKVTKLETLLPLATQIVPLSGLLVSVMLAFRKIPADGAAFFWNCAIVQMFAVLLLSGLSSLNSGELDLYFGHVSYGVFFLFFAVLAFAIAVSGERDVRLEAGTIL